MSTVTDMAQAWHDDGDDNAHVLYNVAEEIAEATIEKYDLEPSGPQRAKLEMVLHEIIDDSIDWDKIAEDDENARDFEDARMSALYK